MNRERGGQTGQQKLKYEWGDMTEEVIKEEGYFTLCLDYAAT